MNILFFGDGKWARLSFEQIVQREEFKILGVVLRYKTPDKQLKHMAKQKNIPVYICKNVNNDDFIKKIKEQDIDLCVSMSFDQIVKKELREVSKYGFINCHAGKLPNYRGRNVINWALINDEKEIGITVHFLDDGIDTGDIISQACIPITEEDNYGTLLEKVEHKCPEILLDAIYKIKYGRYNPIKQNFIAGSYFSYRREGDELIDWNWTSRKIHNFIRALYHPGPGAQTFYKNQKIYIWESEETNYPSYISTPGEVIYKDAEGVIVKTGDTAIKIKKISKDINGLEFIPTFKVGERLGINLYNKILELEKEIKNCKNLISQLMNRGI